VSPRLAALCDRQLLLLFTVLGEGRARLVYANRSLFPFATVKLNGFGSFSLKIQLWPLWEPPGWPGVSGCLLDASWVPPGCLLGGSWVSPGCLLAAFASLGASWVAWGLWVPSGCFLGASWVPPGWLLGVSWMPPGCFLGMSWVASGESSSRLPCSLLQDC
jgi:hypothetical protein